MGLLPLEFTDCLQDSPYFRDSLHSHEKELERTSQNIKDLVKEVKNLINAAKNLSKAQRSLSQHLVNFKFDCIGSNQTDDELVIAGSLKEFGRLISAIEDARDKMLERAADNFITPLEKFRKEHIGSVKERKKQFDKQTAKFCASQERYLGLSTKKQDNVLQEADASLEMEQRDFARAALEYVCLIQEVQERKKFEFVETIQAFMYGWLTFYHEGHEVEKDFRPYMTELQVRVQNTRENFKSSRDDIQALMRKMLEVRQTKPVDPGTLNKMYTRTGYLFFMEKKALGTTWQKCYCQYIRENRTFCMIPYNQTNAKITSTESFRLKSCIRRTAESIDKRFCFDIIPEDRPNTVYTLQAQTEEDRLLWLEALDGTEPMYAQTPGGKPSNANQTYLDESGFTFVQDCLAALEARGLDDKGIYRVVGVGSKVTKLLTMGLDRRKAERLNFEDNIEWETKTITSAVKTFFRNLPEPIMTFHLHSKFIEAAKCESYSRRLLLIHRLVQQLPSPNQRMLEVLLSHLSKVAGKSDTNKMTVSNLGVCFGPTLFRAEEETVAAIMDIKFTNVVVEIMIGHWEQLLKSKPDTGAPPPKPGHSRHSTSGSTNSSPVKTSSTSTSPVKPPPYVPPPLPPAPTPGPTLVHTQIYDGPQVATVLQSGASGQALANSNGPVGGSSSGVSYATWERTLRGQGHLQASSQGQQMNPPAQSPHRSSVSSSLSNLSVVSGLSSTSNLVGGTPSTGSGTPSWQPRERVGGRLGPGPGVRSSLVLSKPAALVYSDCGASTGHSSTTGGPSLRSSNSSSSSIESVASWSSKDTSATDKGVVGDMGSTTSILLRQPPPDKGGGMGGLKPVELRKVRTLYACVGEHETELSFEPNQIISSVRPSLEPGWLEGNLDGKVGLVPENYVEYVT